MVERAVRRRAWVVAGASACVGWLVAIAVVAVFGGFGFLGFLGFGLAAGLVVGAITARASGVPGSAAYGLTFACWVLTWPVVIVAMLVFTTTGE